MSLERPEDQAELFRRLAAGYDEAIRRYQPMYDAMLRLSTDLARVAASGRTRCLDYGTGTGAAIPLLAASFDEVVAIDPGKPMVDLARARVSRERSLSSSSRVSFIEGMLYSSEAKGLRDESFDAVHCSLVLMFVRESSEKLQVLRFFHRLLRSGGALVLSELVTSADGRVEQATIGRWKELMRHRGADDDFIAAAERQVYATMYRNTPDQLRSLLEEAGFQRVEQPFHVLHTVALLANR